MLLMVLEEVCLLVFAPFYRLLAAFLGIWPPASTPVPPTSASVITPPSLTPLPLSFPCKDPCDYMGPPERQDSLLHGQILNLINLQIPCAM